MEASNRKNLFVGLAAGVGIAGLAAIMMGQGASQPVKSAAEYYVTADGEGAQWRALMQPWLEQTLGHSVFNPNTESDRFFASRHPGVDFRALKAEGGYVTADVINIRTPVA